MKLISKFLLSVFFAMMFVTAAQAAPKLIKKVPPEFPAEASRKGIASGTVKAKLSIDAEGKVTEVTILEAEPQRVFDRAVASALMEWRFEGNGEKQTNEVKLVFHNED